MSQKDTLTGVAIACAAVLCLLLVAFVWMIFHIRKKNKKVQARQKNQQQPYQEFSNQQIERQSNRSHGRQEASERASQLSSPPLRANQSNRGKQIPAISGNYVKYDNRFNFDPVMINQMPRYMWRYLYKFEQKTSLSVLTGGGPEGRHHRAQEMQNVNYDDDTLPNSLPRSTLTRSMPDIREQPEETTPATPYASGFHLDGGDSQRRRHRSSGHLDSQPAINEIGSNQTYVNVTGPSTVVMNGLVNNLNQNHVQAEPTSQHPPSDENSTLGAVTPPQFGTYASIPPGVGTTGSWAFLSPNQHYQQLRNQQLQIQQHQQRQYGMSFNVGGDYQVGEWISAGFEPSTDSRVQYLNNKAQVANGRHVQHDGAPQGAHLVGNQQLPNGVPVANDSISGIGQAQSTVGYQDNVTTISNVGFPY